MSTRKTIEKFNELLYSSRDKIYAILGITDNITLFIALGALIYSIGFDLESDEISQVFRWLEGLIVIFIIDYFIRMLYSFKRIEYIKEKFLESILVYISIIIVLGNIFQLHILYNLFLLLGLSDYRVFYEFFIATYLFILTVIGIARASRLISLVKIKPATTFIASFVVLILGGALFLMMPAMTTDVGSMPFLGALFISTSASCVTGLSTVTVGSYFTVKGQIAILILIQLGGIGIVSFATFFATFLSQGVGMKQQAIIQDVLSSESLSSAKNMLRQVIILSFAIEAIGAAAIFFSWWETDITFYSPVSQSEEMMVLVEEERVNALKDSVSAQEQKLESTGPIDIPLENLEDSIVTDSMAANDEYLPDTASHSKNETHSTDVEHSQYALDILFVPEEAPQDSVALPSNLRINNSLSNKIYYSIFHSISAFCNAGFSLFPNGMAEAGVDQAYVFHLIIAFIIIFGSLGFSTIQDVFSVQKMRERLEMPWKEWSLGTRIAVNMTIILCVGGTIGFYFFEQGHTLKGKNLFESIVTSFFQSVTTRTAGFNTVSLGSADIANPTYIMFIFLMFVGAASGSTGGGIKTSTFRLLVASALASIQGKKAVEIAKRTISNDNISRAFSIVAFAISYNLACILLLSIVQPDAYLLELFFEQISAFGTVGLSQGITSSLNEYSQVIIIMTMYIGRVGTLTLALALSKKVISTSYSYPTAHVMVG
ncbi:MAG: potassium transporter TrkG [Microscillaceae bacterium]|nr:potassium transporter TrkG [Microscillaceae bacterium]